MTGEIIRLFIIDDQASVRQGLRMCLSAEPDMTVIGEAASGQAALTLAQTLRPDVIVTDIEMPGLDGIETMRALRAFVPVCPVIVLSIHDDEATRARAMAAGAAAFVTKRGATDMLLAAIRQAVRRARRTDGLRFWSMYTR